MIDPGLSGKVALITGANHGIGEAIARSLAKQSTSVLIQYLSFPYDGGGTDVPGGGMMESRRAQDGGAVAADIRKNGGRAAAVEGDLSDPAFVVELFDQVENLLGPVDILVNNAAHGELETFVPHVPDQPNRYLDLRPAEDLLPFTAEGHDRHFAVNSRAVALMMAEFARRHVERGAQDGAIVNISTDGSSGFPGEVSYGASKYALESYTRAAAYELGQYGIRVNVVSPGPVQTGYITAELEEFLVPRIPLRCIGQPQDIADAVVFVVSAQAKWITGQIIRVNGGNTM
jgi:3-oxoacyl-[acyl-carrier protein] reductase